MNINHSRRLLIIGAPDSGALNLVKDLTGSAPPLNENGTTAGLTHEWDVKTPYYNTKVPIWIDEVTDLEEWKTEFLKPEAKEVIEAVGAWVYCFRKSAGDGPSKEAEETMKALQDITEAYAGYGADSVMLAVAMPSNMVASGSGEGKTAEWEDMCLENGFELVDYASKGTNEFGEKTGFERLKEALEANEWAATIHPDDEADFEDFDLGNEHPFTGQDEAEMTAELFGMKASLAGAEDFEHEAPAVSMGQGQAGQVEDLDRLMGRLMAVKEQSADLPEAERKRVAARAVRELVGDDGTFR